MNLSAYIRTSTSEQDYSNQIPAIMEFCKSHGWPEPEIYAEAESAWKAGHQKELARLLDDLRSGKRRFDYLVIWSLDRLSREGALATMQRIATFESLGCKVVSVKETWIADSGQLRDVFIMLVSWLAQFESSRRSERTRAGLDRVKASGKKLGRPKGSKDKGRRRRSGYYQRYSKKGAVDSTHETPSVEIKTN